MNDLRRIKGLNINNIGCEDIEKILTISEL